MENSFPLPRQPKMPPEVLFLVSLPPQKWDFEGHLEPLWQAGAEKVILVGGSLGPCGSAALDPTHRLYLIVDT